VTHDPLRTFGSAHEPETPATLLFPKWQLCGFDEKRALARQQICRFPRENVPRHTPLPRFGRALLDAAPEPKEGWFAAGPGHEDLARYGSLDVVAVIERRLGG
jgi:hypothetical protein